MVTHQYTVNAGANSRMNTSKGTSGSQISGQKSTQPEIADGQNNAGHSTRKTLKPSSSMPSAAELSIFKAANPVNHTPAHQPISG